MSQKNTNPKLVIHPGVDWSDAVRVAEAFKEDYPDRVGAYHGVGVLVSGRTTLYVYRTEGGTIVVRQ